MSRADDLRIKSMNQPADTTGMPSACQRRDLTDWSLRGGKLPALLAWHIDECPGCARQVRRVNQTHASLALLRTQPTPRQFWTKSNNRALRMLRRIARASAKANHLLRIGPNLSRWQRARIHIARASLGAAAAFLIMFMRAGVFTGLEKTQDYGEALASLHWERHIDPDGEWFGPRDWA
ncbi:MAG: hypothetical protein JSV03_14265 [Planctomycetota bacterium]|nr:MAG: hypothetical protein JSV03_14265 [Planctomycetota bacterium]